MTNSASRKLSARCTCCAAAPTFSADVSRRNFLSGGAAAVGLGLGTAAIPSAAPAQTPAKRRIDVHHHVVPPMQKPHLPGAANTNAWTVARTLDDMDKAGVATSVTSIINPGVWFGKVDEASRQLARECKEWCAKLEQDHPGRFKTFAVIPLPDT